MSVDPFMGVSVATITRLLEQQGLHVITAAEKGVLDAMAAVDAGFLEFLRDREEWYDIEWGGELRDEIVAACRAELARRGAKP